MERITRSKLKKIKIFHTIRGHLTKLGIKPTPSTRFISFNGKLLLGFLFFVFLITTCALFLIYLAKNIVEYMQCVCIFTALFEIGLCFSAIVVQRRRLFSYIRTMEKLVNKSKTKRNKMYPFVSNPFRLKKNSMK